MKKISLGAILLILAILITACSGSDTDSDFKLNNPNITTRSDDYSGSYSYKDGYYFLNDELTFNDALERYCKPELKENGGEVSFFNTLWEESWNSLTVSGNTPTEPNEKKVTCILEVVLEKNGEYEHNSIWFYFIYMTDTHKLYPAHIVMVEDDHQNVISDEDEIIEFINDIYNS